MNKTTDLRRQRSQRPGHIRQALFRLLGIEVDERLAALDDTQQALHETLSHTLAWIRQAEAHLAALQEDHTRLRASLESLLLASMNAQTPPIEWMQGAEAHLAALQAESERLRSLTHRHTDQLMRVIERTALLEARLSDLERADTDIAVAIARSQVSD